MPRWMIAACTILLTTITLPAQDKQPASTFTSIFNGKDLTGWYGWDIHGKGGSPSDMANTRADDKAKKIAGWTADAEKHWSVQNGELVNDGHGAYLASQKNYRDYELKLDYKTVAKADSGIYLKATPQVQIWDLHRRVSSTSVLTRVPEASGTTAPKPRAKTPL